MERSRIQHKRSRNPHCTEKKVNVATLYEEGLDATPMSRHHPDIATTLPAVRRT